jgi:hypothetical protein
VLPGLGGATWIGHIHTLVDGISLLLQGDALVVVASITHSLLLLLLLSNTSPRLLLGSTSKGWCIRNLHISLYKIAFP